MRNEDKNSKTKENIVFVIMYCFMLKKKLFLTPYLVTQKLGPFLYSPLLWEECTASNYLILCGIVFHFQLYSGSISTINWQKKQKIQSDTVYWLPVTCGTIPVCNAACGNFLARLENYSFQSHPVPVGFPTTPGTVFKVDANECSKVSILFSHLVSNLMPVYAIHPFCWWNCGNAFHHASDQSFSHNTW